LDLADYILANDWKPENERNERNESQKKTFIKKPNTDGREIEILKDRISQRRSESKAIWQKIRMVRNQIENHFISEEAIRANKDLLRAVRGW